MPVDVDRRQQPVTPLRRAQVLVAAGALAPGIVLSLLALVLGPIESAAVLVVVVAVSATWLWRGGERRVLASLDGRAAAAASDARLLNLVDGLCSTAGLRQPRVIVTPHKGLNLLVAGRSVDHAVLAVTAGLAERLSRIELEGVLADGLVQIRRGDIIPATVAVATFGLGARFAGGPGDHDAEVDVAGVALTLYPPAMARAFETMERLGTVIPGVPSSMTHLWLADPRPVRDEPRSPRRSGAAVRSSGRPALLERVSALREL